jgi:2-polyprenyl-6-methoxyphenol hydroxylase-like FAD-dependent oxidoreductase
VLVRNFTKLECCKAHIGQSKETISKVTLGHPWPFVTLKDGTKLQGRLVVGADGGRSVARSYLAPNVVGWSYSQNAVVTTVSHPEGIHNDTAWQQFLPSGPVALLPVCKFFILSIAFFTHFYFSCMTILVLLCGLHLRNMQNTSFLLTMMRSCMNYEQF